MLLLLPNGSSATAETSESPYLNGIASTTSAAGFVHPGVFLGLPELEAVRREIVAGGKPQATIFAWLKSTSNRDLVERKPVWDVYSDAQNRSSPCDPHSSHGCVIDAGYGGEKGRNHTNSTKRDIGAQINSAYTNALLYYYSGGDEYYAQNAVRTLNAYGHVLKGFASTDANGHVGDLFAAWMSQTLVRAAEIIRYTYVPTPGSESFDVESFERMLRTAFVPRLWEGTAHINNWRTSAAEGLMNIGIFLDDRNLYDRALAIWRDVTPAYIYVLSDGERPSSLLQGSEAQKDCSWIHNFSRACKKDPKVEPGLVYQNGQNQEICRDMWHSSAGVGGIINAAETAYLQGDDLYGEEESRMMTGLSYMVQISRGVEHAGYPDDFCADAAEYGGVGSSGLSFPTEWKDFEPLSAVVAYNHYFERKGLAFPLVKIAGYHDTGPHDPVAAFIDQELSGPHDTRDYVTSWQVLTHHGVGAGVPPHARPLTRPSASPSADWLGAASKASEESIGGAVRNALLFVSLIAVVALLAAQGRRKRPLE
ncbi:alginate lyase family protein [Microbacterium sp. USHLN186]|uniref:alginate lyase family protein n=1 Tax=Microbacterium sp. USHLN186 TaxID=3081286 RepID=UPI003018D08A